MQENISEKLRKEHGVSVIQTYFKEIVYGASDGIVTTFAVVSGFSGADLAARLPNLSFFIVFLFGLANLAADGISMGFSNFLSLRSEKDVYKKEEEKERQSLLRNPKREKEETEAILTEKGFSSSQAKNLTEIYATNPKYWLSFMMNHEHEMPNPTKENPVFTGGATFLAFVFFGSIPLIPFIFSLDTTLAFQRSVIATFSALVVLGLLRWRVTKESIIRSVFEIVLVGGIASVAAYIVGTFFRL